MSSTQHHAKLEKLQLLPIRRMVQAGAALEIAERLLGKNAYTDLPGDEAAWSALRAIAVSANDFLSGPPARNRNAVFKAMNAAGFADHRSLRTITMGELAQIFETLKPQIKEALR